MAKKSLILSNDNGKVVVTNTSSLSVDDVTENIPLNQVTASVLKISGLADNTSRLLKINSSGTGSTFNNNTVGNSALLWDGTSWTNNTGVIATRYTGSTGGHISGSIDQTIIARSVAGVNSGILSTNNGGTGANISTNLNAILEVSKSAGGVVSYSSLSSTNGTVLAVQNNNIRFYMPAYYPDVQFFGTPGTYTWIKPPSAKFVRIMLQGAGGGGGGGSNASPNYYGGGGGGSGGWTDITVVADSFSTATIQVGLGGAGGTAAFYPNYTYGISGGSTTFYSSIGNFSSGGGEGAYAGNNSTTVANGGSGMTKNGYAGAAPNASYPAVASYGMPSGGGKGSGTSGGGATSGGTVTAFINDRNFGYTVDKYGNSLSIAMAAGAAGSTTTPAKPGYGAGGGGGGAGSGLNYNGGSGGDGYALIIAW